MLHTVSILSSVWSMDLMKPSEGPQPSKRSAPVTASLSRPGFGRGRSDFSSGDDCRAHNLRVCCRRGRRCFPSLSGSQLEKRSGCGTRCQGRIQQCPFILQRCPRPGGRSCHALVPRAVPRHQPDLSHSPRTFPSWRRPGVAVAVLL